MTWVIDRGGTVAYKASWTVAANIAAFLGRCVRAKRGRPARAQIGPYYTEQLELRDVAREAFLVRLERNGMQAVEQWRRAEKLMRREDPRPEPSPG